MREAISLTAQEAAVDGLLTGAENLRMMARLRRVKDRDRPRELLERLDLTEAADRRVAHLLRRHAPPTRPGDEPDRRARGSCSSTSRPPAWTRAAAPRSGTAVTKLAGRGHDDPAHDPVPRGGRPARGPDRRRQRTAGSRRRARRQELKARVGEETAELFFADAAALAAAASALDGPTSDERLSLRLPVDGAEDVRRALDTLAAAGFDADRLELHKPTLDEVFLALT